MPARKKLPAAALAVAIMNLVLFAPCLCCSGFSAAMGAAGDITSSFASTPQQKELQKKTQEAIEKEAPNAKPVGLVFNVINVILSTLMIVAAIGLFMGKPWARLLCILGCIALLLVVAGNSLFEVLVTIPAGSKVFDEQMKNQNAQAPQGAFGGLMYIGVVLRVLIIGGYAIIAIGLLMTSSVRRAFSGSPIASAVDFDDRSREDDDDDRRRDDRDDRYRAEDDR